MLSGHYRTTLSGYIFTTKACIHNPKKKLLNSNISSTCPHNKVNFGPLTAEIGWGVCGTPADFTGFASWLHYCTDVAQRRLTKLCTMFGCLLGWYTIYIFGGSCPLTFRPSLACPTLAALLLGTRVVGTGQTLWHGTRKGITELSFLVCATYIPQGGHHVGHQPRF